MAHRKGGNPSHLLTDVELELMNIIWDLGDVTVKDVVQALPKDRPLAYTSVATVMKILEDKGFLLRKKEGHAHAYEALIPRGRYEAQCLDHMVTHVFQGQPQALVKRLLNANAQTVSAEEWKTIEALVNRLAEAKERKDG